MSKVIGRNASIDFYLKWRKWDFFFFCESLKRKNKSELFGRVPRKFSVLLAIYSFRISESNVYKGF